MQYNYQHHQVTDNPESYLSLKIAEKIVEKTPIHINPKPYNMMIHNRHSFELCDVSSAGRNDLLKEIQTAGLLSRGFIDTI